MLGFRALRVRDVPVYDPAFGDAAQVFEVFAYLGYLHIAEADWDDAPLMPVEFKQRLRAAYPGVLIYAGKYTAERAREAIAAGWADLIAFGRPFVANPDLPERLRMGAELAPHDRDTLFGGDARGLTDYQTLAEAAA
ncbi:hypothetical protein WJ67_17960 [Burkholderia ubonensis]|nr:hypothetical protein WJ67_17960 [Burkholderia ubonensis]